MAAGQDEGLTSASIAGALCLFAEEERGDRQAREALFCTIQR
jgi:hypothetical protein